MTDAPRPYRNTTSWYAEMKGIFPFTSVRKATFSTTDSPSAVVTYYENSLKITVGCTKSKNYTLTPILLSISPYPQYDDEQPEKQVLIMGRVGCNFNWSGTIRGGYTLVASREAPNELTSVTIVPNGVTCANLQDELNKDSVIYGANWQRVILNEPYCR